MIFVPDSSRADCGTQVLPTLTTVTAAHKRPANSPECDDEIVEIDESECVSVSAGQSEEHREAQVECPIRHEAFEKSKIAHSGVVKRFTGLFVHRALVALATLSVGT